MILKYFSRRDWLLTAVCVVFIVFQVYLDLRLPDYMNEITDAIQLGEDNDIVVRDGVRMIGCALLSVVASFASGGIAANVAANVCRTLRRLQFDRVQSFSTQDIDRFSAASLITRSTNDVYQLMNFIARGMQLIVKSPILAVWAICKIAGRDWQWTAATAAAVLILLAAVAVTMWYTLPRFRRIQWLTDGINRVTRESLDGIRVIRAYNAEEYQQRKFERANGALLDNNVSAVHAMSGLFPLTSSITNFLTLAIYWIGAGIIQAAPDPTDKMYLFSDMIVFSSYALQIISAFMMMTGVVRQLPRAMVAARRVEEVIGTEPSIKDGKEEGPEPRAGGTVEFRDVGFTYPGSGVPALEHVSFTARPGETVAFIGSTGSGKSTLVSLIPRFYDVTSGQVLVDGLDVREYTQTSLHRRIGYVPQSAVIFSGTVERNVNYGDTAADRTEGDVRRALGIAQALDFVDKMEGGTQAHVSQHGRNVSGGQKQRICIARAVCRRPEIYVFDDTFSALDFKTDRSLRDALRRESGGATTIIVAQRVGTIMDADRIIVLDGGRVVGSGTHEELMETCGIYRDIAESQMTGVGGR